VLIPNHFHLLLKTGKEPIAQIMSAVKSSIVKKTIFDMLSTGCHHNQILMCSYMQHDDD
jgi:transposase